MAILKDSGLVLNGGRLVHHGAVPVPREPLFIMLWGRYGVRKNNYRNVHHFRVTFIDRRVPQFIELRSIIIIIIELELNNYRTRVR